MRFADVDEAQKHRAALLEVVIHHVGGWADRRCLRKIQESCEAARSAIDDAECATCIETIAKYAAALYSERSHRNWDHGSIRGADFLRLEIVRALHSLNRRLCEIELGRRGARMPGACGVQLIEGRRFNSR